MITGFCSWTRKPLLRHLPIGPLLLAVAGLLPAPGNAAAQGPCGPPVVNAIACENSQPGNPASEWDIVGAGSPSIQGFATDISVDRGETVHFKVDTDATSYRLDIYRLGYYNGTGARFVATVQPTVLLPQDQPACVTDAASGLVDCGTWSESASWTVPVTATSGVYLAKLVREDGIPGASHIVFVVRDDDGNSDLLFQTSDTTWQAYNDYGGNSLYLGGPGTAPARAYKVSYNRPFVTRGNGFARSWLFGTEYPMIRWLEANGFDVSYSTGIDTARLSAELLEHQVFLSVGHDEYWSAEQRASVEAARNAGVHLAFFSGNEMFWKTRWEASIDGSGTPHRTLVAYKETHANAKIDPVQNVWTGTWRDPRFSPPADGGRPENAVTGTLFMVNCCRQDAITIPEPLGKLRFWRNTSVATLQPGQTATLPAGVLGYEWDEAPDNGFAPDGLVRLSSTTVPNLESQYLIDHGSLYGSGTGTHSLTLHRQASGAFVFGAGTIRWSWGLDGTHDQDSLTPGATTTPDGRMQQATINLFADMGVQPATLQPGLVAATASADATAPTSTITSPASGSTAFPGIPLTISGTASDTGGGTVAAVEVSVDGGVTWHPATGLQNWSYTWIPPAPGPVSIVSSAIDDSGNIELPQSGVTIDVQMPPPDLGRVAAYSFDTDGGASVADISGNGHTGAVSGSTWSPDGKFGGALSFDGIDDWVTVADSPLLDLTTGMTLSAWVYPTAGGDYREVVIKEAPGGEAYNLYASSDGSVPIGGVVLGQNPILAVAGPQPLPLNAWSHLALTFDSAALRLYVNGALTGTRPASGTITTSSGALRFGGNSIWGQFFAGRIDEIRVYDRALIAAEITTAMNTPIGSSTNQPPTAVAQATPTSGIAPLTVAFDGTGSTDPDPGDTIVSHAWDLDGDGQHDDSFVAQPQLTYGAVGTYSVTLRVTDDRGASSVSNPLVISVTAPPPTCPCSLWDSAATPVILADSDPSAVELGVKVRSDVAGYITGLRFYKGPGNAGPHRGNLWTSTGTLLASVTFSGETASGWQAATLPTPVAISANTTYVASYHAPAGHYSADVGYFASTFANPPLRAPATGASGGNGVFRYGPSSFPTTPANGNNYWVDVVFNTTSGPADTSPPTVTAVSPGGGASAVNIGTSLTATFSEPVDPATVGASTFQLRDSSSALVAASVTYDATTHTATLQPSPPLAWATTYTARLAGGTTDPRVRDFAGNALAADYTWSFTTSAVPACPCTIWDSATTPAILTDSDSSAIELGVKFQSDSPGFITGIRLYKGPGNAGPHVGRLWTRTGTLLASVTFAGETASGWQQASFSSPVAITANTTYVASYHAPAGHFSANAAYFATAGVDNPPLHALANGVDGGNAVFLYGPGGFPSQSVNGNNYWVDVVFTTSAPPADTTAPSVTAVSPLNGAAGVGVSTAVTVTFDEDVAPSTITTSTFELRDHAGAVVASTVAYDAGTLTATLTPTSPPAGSASYLATVKGGSTGTVVTDLSGNALTSSVTWGFTTAPSVATGFTESVIFSGLTEPTAVRFAPDGRVFVAEKSGLIKVFASLSATTATIFADLRTQTHNFWDRGLLGLELDPDFPARPYVYVLYVYDAAIGETAPQWGTAGGTSDGCPDPPGANTGGCVASGRLSRLQAAGSVMTGQGQVLIEGWGVQYPTHSVGSLAFGGDGALYVSGGDGASFTFVDYGQAGNPPNPLGDPPVPVGGAQAPPTAQGGALRSQSLRRPLATPCFSTGPSSASTPIPGRDCRTTRCSALPNARRIVGYGLRNPFRIAPRPGTPEIWVGDVGWNDWEEINVIGSPLGTSVANFGWPCYEGTGRQPGYEAAGLTMCATLYTQPTAVTAPLFTYHHSAHVVNGETCSVGGSAITGLAFYQGGSYPAFYDGALFFTDYARGCIWVMFEDATGVPDPGSRAVFRSGAASPVDLQIGPGGDLFYADIVGGTIRRVRFSAGNQPPTAVLQGQPLSGAAPLTVNFPAPLPTDPDDHEHQHPWHMVRRASSIPDRLERDERRLLDRRDGRRHAWPHDHR